MGSGGADLMMSPAARRAFPFTIECKKTAADPGRKAMKQAQFNADKGTLGAVVWQTSGEGGTKGEIRFDLVEFIDWYLKLDCFENRVRNMCSNCFGKGRTPGKPEIDEYGCMKSYDEICAECKGSGKNNGKR